MKDYGVWLIRELLSNYAALEAGQLPVSEVAAAEYWGPKMTRRGNAVAPFELAAMMKTDIDRAIQQLPPAFKFVILAVDIDERNLFDCAFWLGKSIGDVAELEDKAVRTMAGILRGGNRGGYRPGAGRKSS